MATGDQTDMLGRVKAFLPRGWFPTITPVLDGFLSGPSNALAFAYSLLAYARLQTRIATVSDGFLDMAAYDFFGLVIQRRTGEADASFRARLRAEVFRPRQTRAGMIKAITDLTGRAPILVEPWNVTDCGGWETGSFAWSGGGVGGGGCWGTQLLPNSVLMTVYRPGGEVGVSGYGGWSSGTGSGATPSSGGWNGAGFAWVTASMYGGPVSDQEILDTINRTKPAGVTVWVHLI